MKKSDVRISFRVFNLCDKGSKEELKLYIEVREDELNFLEKLRCDGWCSINKVMERKAQIKEELELLKSKLEGE